MGHVIDSGALMHYASSNGTTARTVDSDTEAGANAKLDFSLTTPCFTPGAINGLMVLLNSGNCSLEDLPTADIGVEKTVTDATPNEGDAITYTITVTNNGPDDATNMSLTDSLPNGVTRTATAANASQGSFDEGSGVWTIGSIANAGSATLQLEVTVDAGASSLSQPITNTTSGLTLDETDSNASNDTGSVDITVNDNLDLLVDKTVTDSTPDEGDTITYTITISNNGPALATNVAITDSLPNGVTRTATAASASQGSFNDGTGIWTVGNIANSSSATLQLEVTVDAGAANLSQPIINSTSNLIVDQTDTNTANNIGSIDINVNNDLDLAVVKTVSEAILDEGDTFTYTITVTNNGPAQATNVSLTDSLPNGVTRTATAANASQGSFNEGSGVWTIGTIANAANATLQLEVTIDAGSSSLAQPITNTTSALTMDQNDTDTGNDVGSADITVNDDLDLAVTKSVTNTTPTEGETITYTIIVSNSGPARATNVSLTDSLPNGVTRTATAPNASQGSFVDGTGIWTVGTIDSGNNATLQLEVSVDSGAASLSQPITNTTTGLMVDQTDGNAANNSGTVDINIVDGLDLLVEKTVSNAAPDEGDTITYTITVTNNGPNQATNVSLTDEIPNGVSRNLTPAMASQGSFNEGSGVWTIGTLDDTASATLSFEVAVDVGASALAQPITNITSNLTVDQNDSNDSNDVGSVDINVGNNLDLAVSKMVSDATPNEGDTLTYTINVTNNGPTQATNVALTDNLPNGVTRTATAAGASQGDFNDKTGVWTVGTLDDQASASLTLEVTVDAGAAGLPQPITNTTSNLLVDQNDTDENNDTGSADINVGNNLDLLVTKTVDNATPNETDTITYTITVNNSGPTQASNVALTDNLPNGVTRTATPASASQGDFNEGTGMWTIGTLDDQAMATLTLEVTVDSGAASLSQPITNTTSNLTLDQNDTDNSNDSGSADINVSNDLDLAVLKEVDNPTPDEGDTVTYKITVTNNGPLDATNVALTDVLPEGVTLAAGGINPSQGSYDEGSGVWTIGSIADQGNAVLNLGVTVDVGASTLSQPILNNTSNLVVDQNDIDDSNDIGSVSITVNTAIDLAVSLSASETNPCEEDVLSFTLTVNNLGPEDAENTSITLTLPGGVTPTATAANASQGSYDDGSGVWAIGSLADQASATLTVEAEVNSNAGDLNQPLIATTNAVSADQADGNATNDSDTAEVTVVAGLVIATDITDQDACEGGSVTFTFDLAGSNPTYQWFKDNEPINGETSASLTLNSLTNDDVATYFCEATNACSMVTSFSAMLTLSGSLTANISPPFATQGLDPIVLTGTINCNIDNPLFDWVNLDTQETATGPVLQLPTQLAPSVWQLTVTDPTTSETTVVTAAILATANSDYYDYNNDGCNDLFDLYDLALDWTELFPGDPNNDGVIDIRDLLMINVSDPLGCEP